jgi:hydroxymethylpyrimidine/phosphomethylpyrimidine kinase
MKYILTIAGSDSCGGAGIQADIKTITGLGAHALTAITAVTAQNSLGIRAIQKVPARFIAKQLETIVEDVTPDAVKIGMLYSEAAVRVVARFIKKYRPPHIVFDPVLVSSTGSMLLEPGTIPSLKELLLPLVDVVTPNLYESGILTNKVVNNIKGVAEAAREIKAMGPDAVITGGHLRGRCMDLLYDGKEAYRFYGSRIPTIHTHGTGCVFSTALATFLAMKNDMPTATKRAHEYTRCAIMKGYKCGRGAGPVLAGLPVE